MVLDCMDRPRGQDSGLPHATAEQFAGTPRFGDEFASPSQRRANGRAQTLTETDTHRIERIGKLSFGSSACHRCVPQSSAVEMAVQVVVSRPLADRFDGLLREDPSTPAVVGVPRQTN